MLGPVEGGFLPQLLSARHGGSKPWLGQEIAQQLPWTMGWVALTSGFSVLTHSALFPPLHGAHLTPTFAPIPHPPGKDLSHLFLWGHGGKS